MRWSAAADNRRKKEKAEEFAHGRPH